MLTMVKPMDDCETVTIKQQAMIEAIWQKNVKDVLLVGRTWKKWQFAIYALWTKPPLAEQSLRPDVSVVGRWGLSGSASTSMNGWLMCTHACTRSRRVSWRLIAVQCFGDIETGPIRCLGRERSSLSMFCLGKSWGLSFQGLIGFAMLFSKRSSFQQFCKKNVSSWFWKIASNDVGYYLFSLCENYLHLHKCFLTLGSSSNTDKTADDLVEQVAADMMKEAWLLCFDEFQVTHISISASENLEVVVSYIFYFYPYLGK